MQDSAMPKIFLPKNQRRAAAKKRERFEKKKLSWLAPRDKNRETLCLLEYLKELSSVTRSGFTISN